MKRLEIPKGYRIKEVDGNIVLLEITDAPTSWEESIKSLDNLEYITSKGSIQSVYEDNLTSNIKLTKNMIPKDMGNKMLALMQLIICRNAWVKDWKPDWNSTCEKKFCIKNVQGTPFIAPRTFESAVMSFPSKDMCEKFLDTFEPLIQTALELL
jgi:hypothetical protein